MVKESDPFAKPALRIAEIAEVKEGWLNGEGQPFPLDLVKLGSKILHLIKSAGLDPPRVFPSEESEISFEWATATYVLSLEIEPDLTILVYQLAPDETSGTETLIESLDHLPEILKEWKETLCG